MRTILRKLLVIVVGAIGISSFFLSFPLFSALERNSPVAPAPASKQLYEMNDHGYLFYVTRGEYYLFNIMVGGGWSLAALAAVLNYRWKVVHNFTQHGSELPK